MTSASNEALTPPSSRSGTPAFTLQEDIWFGDFDDEHARRAAADSMSAMAGRIMGARPIPAAAQKLVQLTREDDADVHKVVRVLEMDPGLSQKVLRLVNSAGYGLRIRCTSLQHATALLGQTKLRQIATSAVLFDHFGKPAPLTRKKQEHGSLVASLCRYLAIHLGLPHDDLFTIGLLHDIGQLMMLDDDLPGYAALLGDHDESFDSLHVAERELLGFDHAVLAAHVLASWSIPSPVPDVIALHHQPSVAHQHSLEVAAMVQTLRFADHMAHLLEHKSHKSGPRELAESEAASYLDFSEMQIAAMWRDLERVHEVTKTRRLNIIDMAPRNISVPESLRPREAPLSARLEAGTPSIRAMGTAETVAFSLQAAPSLSMPVPAVRPEPLPGIAANRNGATEDVEDLRTAPRPAENAEASVRRADAPAKPDVAPLTERVLVPAIPNALHPSIRLPKLFQSAAEPQASAPNREAYPPAEPEPPAPAPVPRAPAPAQALRAFTPESQARNPAAEADEDEDQDDNEPSDGAENRESSFEEPRWYARPSSNDINPEIFPCTFCYAPTFGASCGVCGAQVCSAHMPEGGQWCVACEEEYQAYARAHQQNPIVALASAVSTTIASGAAWYFGSFDASLAVLSMGGLVLLGFVGTHKARTKRGFRISRREALELDPTGGSEPPERFHDDNEADTALDEIAHEESQATVEGAPPTHLATQPQPPGPLSMPVPAQRDEAMVVEPICEVPDPNLLSFKRPHEHIPVFDSLMAPPHKERGSEGSAQAPLSQAPEPLPILSQKQPEMEATAPASVAEQLPPNPDLTEPPNQPGNTDASALYASDSEEPAPPPAGSDFAGPPSEDPDQSEPAGAEDPPAEAAAESAPDDSRHDAIPPSSSPSEAPPSAKQQTEGPNSEEASAPPSGYEALSRSLRSLPPDSIVGPSIRSMAPRTPVEQEAPIGFLGPICSPIVHGARIHLPQAPGRPQFCTGAPRGTVSIATQRRA